TISKGKRLRFLAEKGPQRPASSILSPPWNCTTKQLRQGETEFDPKSTASAGLRLNPDISAHALSNLANNRQADARAFILVVELLEHAEEARLRMLWNANAVVLNEDSSHRSVSIGPDPDARLDTGSDKFYGIPHQIRKTLSQERFVSHDHRQIAFDLDFGQIGVEVGVSIDDAPEQDAQIRGLQGKVLEHGPVKAKGITDESVKATRGGQNTVAVILALGRRRR